MKDILEFKVSIRFKTLLWGLIITSVIIIAFLIFSSKENLSYFEKIDIIVKILGTGIAVTTLFYVAINVHLLLETQNKKNRLEIIRHTSEIIRRWSDKDMCELSTIARETWKKNYKKDNETDWKNILENDEKGYMAIISVLNFIEHFNQLIIQNLVDEGMLKEFYAVIVKILKYRFKPFVDFLVDYYEDERAYENFLKLASRWEKN